MRLKKIYILIILSLFSTSIQAQINTNRVLAIGRNALYFEDYVLAMQYFNQVIRIKPHMAEPYFYRGIAKISLEDYSGSEADCNEALSRNPFLIEAYRCRGIARINLNKYKEAIEDFDKGLEFAPENKALLICKAQAAIQNKDYKNAIDYFAHCIKKYPRYKEAYLGRGYSFFANEDTLSALNDFNKTIELDKFYADGLSAKATLLYELENYEEAGKLIDEAIRLEPYKSNFYINRGLIRYQLQNIRGAMDDYNHVVHLAPNNILAYYNRGILRAQIGDDNRAIEDFERVIEFEPDNDFAIYNRAILRNKIGELEGAIADLNTILKKHPHFFPAYYLRADAKSKLFDKKGAEKDYNTGMLIEKKVLTKEEIAKKSNERSTRESSESDLHKHNKLAVASKEEQKRRLTYKGESRGRIQNVNFHIEMEQDILLSFYPTQKNEINKPIHYNHELDLWHQQKKIDQQLYLVSKNNKIETQKFDNHFQTIEKLTAEIEINKSSELYFNRALHFDAISDYDSAIEDCQKAIQIDNGENNWIYYYTLATLRKKRWEYNHEYEVNELTEDEKNDTKEQIEKELIVKEFDQSIKLKSNFPYAWYNRGNTLASLNDYRNAIANYSKAIELNNDFAEAYFNRGLCKIRIGDNVSGINDLSKAGEMGIYVAYNIIKRFREKD